jgi:hypothetical protein
MEPARIGTIDLGLLLVVLLVAFAAGVTLAWLDEGVPLAAVPR